MPKNLKKLVQKRIIYKYIFAHFGGVRGAEDYVQKS